MKKYLMTGIAALALCVGFTSCSHDLDVPSPEKMKEMEAQKIVNNYEKAFKAYVGGNIAANQTWGFGTMASTRTRGDNANANEWANDWIVPQQLTPAQRLRVTRYFQTHKNPGSQPNYGIRNFFVQQVYDGATDPITKLDGFSAPAYSTEVYVPGNGEPINSGEHMDHLTAGPAVEGNGHHILNFNNATYGTNGEPNHDVLNSTGVDYYEWDGWGKNTNYSNTHSDQIQLMLNHATYPWGYEDSSDSHLYTDCWTLVSAATIDAWANSDEAKALGIDLGDPVSTDGWNRDFIGFDFSLLVGDDLYEPVSYGSTELKKAKYDEYMNEAIWGWDGTNVVQIVTSMTNGYIPNYAEGFDGYLYNGTEKVNLLSSNLNKYCVDLIGFDNTTADNKVYHNEIAKEAEYDADSENDNCAFITNVKDADGNIIKKQGLYGETTKFLNLKWLNKMLADGYLPVEGKAMKLWGKPTGCRDGYYSDWIVSFMPADPANEDKPDPATWSVRVMAEDLSATEESDFDFNDVVLDFFGTENSNILNVTLQAAGGTLPLRINEDDALEVHDMFKVAKNVMVNTNWTGSNKADKSAVPFTITLASALTTEQGFLDAVKAIKLEVEKTVSDGTGDAKQWLPMNADQGKAAAKFAVPIYDSEGNEVRWANERESLKDKYGKFSEWATTAPHIKWWDPSKSGDE